VPTEELRRVVARFADRGQVAAGGYVFGAQAARVGDAAVVYSRAAYRAGIVIKVGRLNVTVVYTTETALPQAADPRYGWTEPARTTKAGRFADVAIRPVAAGAPLADATTGAASLPAGSTDPIRRLLGERQFDHNNECVGCGADHADPCHPSCPFETRVFSLAMLLRAAARRLRDNPAGVGYDIRGAVFDAAVVLAGAEHACGGTADACEVLTSFLIAQWGPQAEQIRREVVYRHGLFSDLGRPPRRHQLRP
jgi:hypothetical protein